MKAVCWGAALWIVAGAAHAQGKAVSIDGHITPGEWDGATHVTDFRTVQPFTQAPGSLPTEAWYMATPKGLAIAFRNHQPAGVERRRQKTRRDENAQADRVNLMVDYNGDGQIAYNFTLLLGGGIQDGIILAGGSGGGTDWDGDWQHAVSEDEEGWTAEMLIPWHITTMPPPSGDKRRLGLYLDRVIGATGERIAWPAVTFERPQFITGFNQVDLPAYSQASLAVTPYVSAGRDIAHGRTLRNGGVDVFWKPSGQFQLSGTINPDFGQVESDDLVINFGAQESFFSDKRPFFTENQSIFNFNLLLDNSQLVYTRRVGGASDDGHGMAEIDAAVKLNGSVGSTNYGLMWAQERGAAGRSFRALRLTQAAGTHRLGIMATQVLRPWLGRTANVIGIDDSWKPSPRFTLAANIAQSSIAEKGENRRRIGASLLAQQEMDNGWHQSWIALHFDDGFDINDFGYVGRGNIEYFAWELGKRINTLPDTSAYASQHWRFRIGGANDARGLNLQREFRIQRESKLRDGGQQNVQIDLRAPAYDDELLWYHGKTRTTSGFQGNFSHEPGRHGAWQWWTNGEFDYGMGVDPRRHTFAQLGLGVRYFFNDELNASIFGSAMRSGEWLLWRGNNLLGSYDNRRLRFEAALNWNISHGQELRVKLQSIGVSARARAAWRVQPDGSALRSTDVIDDFGLHVLGFQVRYRYELAPLSNLYVVYARGGFERPPGITDVQTQFGRSFGLRKDEQLLVKLAYRFEL